MGWELCFAHWLLRALSRWHPIPQAGIGQRCLGVFTLKADALHQWFLRVGQNHMEALLKHKFLILIWPIPRVFDSVSLRWAWKLAVPKSSQVVPMLLVWGHGLETIMLPNASLFSQERRHAPAAPALSIIAVLSLQCSLVWAVSSAPIRSGQDLCLSCLSSWYSANVWHQLSILHYLLNH